MYNARMMNNTSTLKRIVDILIDIIYKTHSRILSMNDAYESQLSDKQLHFIVIGLLGIAMLLVIYPLISWFYVFTVLVVITFAIEIGQWYSHTGEMDFNDILAGLVGYFAMSFIFLLVVAIIELIKSIFKKK